jgi:hypothetical protein
MGAMASVSADTGATITLPECVFTRTGYTFKGWSTTADGKVVYAECQKGKSDKRGREYPLMREAIGQLVTGCDFGENIVPIVAISNTDKAKELAERWSKLTQIKNMGIKFALVCDEGDVKFI